MPKGPTQSYVATFTDHRGSESAVLTNDRRTLAITIRGIHFRGEDFDSLEPDPSQPLGEVSFEMASGCLCDFSLELSIPMSVLKCDKVVAGELRLHFVLGKPMPSGGVDREELRLALKVDEQSFESPTEGYFESALDQIRRQLPPGWAMKCCYGCQFSDYHPAGQSMFGGMACFRTAKSEYLGAASKTAHMAVWEKRTEFVQETDLCEEFQVRTPNTGYRG